MRRFMVVMAAVAVSSLACTAADDGAAPTASPTTSPANTPSPTPDPAADVRAFVTDFMDARMDRDEERARSFLAPFAADQYTDGEGGLTLTGTSDPHFESWMLVSIQAADASSYEVRVEVTEGFTDSDQTSTFSETLFVGPGTDVDGQQRSFVIRGAQREG